MPELLNDSIPSSAAYAVSRRIFAWPRDTTPAERQTLVAGGLGWMLDAMDVMLYSLVLAFLIREFAMDTRTAGFPQLAHATGLGHRRALVRLAGRPHRAHARTDGFDPGLFHRERRLRFSHRRSATGDVPLLAGTGHGRRVDRGRRADRRDLACRSTAAKRWD